MVIITPDNKKFQKFFKVTHSNKCTLPWVRNNMFKDYWLSLETEDNPIMHKAICYDCKGTFNRMFKTTIRCDKCENDEEQSRRLKYNE